MDTVWQEIGINIQQVCEMSEPYRYELICDKQWLKCLEQRNKIANFTIYPKLDRRAHPTGELEHPWTRILIHNYKKQSQLKVFPLPHIGTYNDSGNLRMGEEPLNNINNTSYSTSLNDMPLTYSQAISYVTNTNFKNLWEAAYKRYSGAHHKFHKPQMGGFKRSNNTPDCDLIPYNNVLKELIQRIFNCPIIHCQNDRLDIVNNESSAKEAEEEECNNQSLRANDCHANILPAIIAIESSNFISVFFYPPAVVTNLHDCITYSPAVLNKSYNKCLFLIYQLLQLTKYIQNMGLFLGDIRLHDILVRENLWIQVIPRLESNILRFQQNYNEHSAQTLTSPSELVAGACVLLDIPKDNLESVDAIDYKQNEHGKEEFVNDDYDDYDDDDDDDGCGDCGGREGNTKFDLKFAYDLQQFSLREYCEMWCNGQMSNYDYLTILNNATGRTLTNPSYHHIMPWVTDFMNRNGTNWRDLSKSKYRLNKGDTHLDLMFSHASQQNPLNAGNFGFSSQNLGDSVSLNNATSTNCTQNIPHHVSDFLSEITYFVYAARRTPQHILCEHVRKVWVPAEYPISIQRLQEWTPDECIPEFYSDPMIFKSIHEDLSDLELPTWATCPEDFISKHREALESQHVSERLHHWIDLNFGYKLSGKAAIKSKNVCLSVVDQHKNLCQRGIVQLFTQPHPTKRQHSLWFNKTAPRLNHLYNTNRSNSKFNPPQTNNMHKLTKSTENLSLNAEQSNNGKVQQTQQSQQDMISIPTTQATNVRTSPRLYNQRPQESTTSTTPSSSSSSSLSSSLTTATATSTFYPQINFIELPKDYNPCQLLQNLETMNTFFGKTFPKQMPSGNTNEKIISGDLLFEQNSDEHSYTNQLFGYECTTPATTPSTTAGSLPIPNNHIKSMKTKNLLAPNAKQMKRKTLKLLVKMKREQELLALGCFIIELFAMQRLRPLLMNGIHITFVKRLEACRTVAELHSQELPNCVRSIVKQLLTIQKNESVTTQHGLPPPTAAQLLEPIFSNFLIPFPTNYYPIYALIRSLYSFNFTTTLLELNTHFNCNGHECSRYTEMDRKRVLFERKIAECKVMSCCAHIGRLLEPLAYEQFPPIELLLPHIIDLLQNEQTSILAAWNLFDPIAQALGIAQTQKYLLAPIMKLYDVESFDRGMISVRPRSDDTLNGIGQIRFSTSSSFKSRKSVKLYHHSFLLRLIVRFGLRCFLNNFIAPLIEAVGGYKEPEDGNGLHYHSTNQDSFRRSNRNYTNVSSSKDDEDNSITLIAPEMADNEDSILDVNASSLKQEMEDVFSFDDDVNSDHISNCGTGENKSIDSFDMRPTIGDEMQEDFNSIPSMPEKISNKSFDDSDKLSLKSQTGGETDYATATHLGPKSPTIDIPSVSFGRNYQLNAITCDIGSRKSIDSFDIITQAVVEDEERKSQEMTNINNDPIVSGVPETDACDSLQASVISKISEAKAQQNNRISEMSAESLVWLSHRLGPVLTSRYITRNLLKMLSLCYVGQENLLPEIATTDETTNLNYFSIADARVIGDRSAARVLECLMSIAALFGEEIVLLQYFPHISELISLGSRRITGSLEGAIISSLQLVKYIIPCLKDVTIMEHLKETFLDAIILPILQLLSSTKQTMPSGYLGRSVLARKLLDAIYTLCIRIGSDMSREHLTIPALRPFFLIFDKAYGITTNFNIDTIRPISPPCQQSTESYGRNCQREEEEIRDVFGPALAHIAYLAFLHFLGEAIMQRTLLNFEFIIILCHEFEQPDYKTSSEITTKEIPVYIKNWNGSDAVDCPVDKKVDTDVCNMAPNSFGTHVIGNRIEVTTASSSSLSYANRSSSTGNSSNNSTGQVGKDQFGPMEVLDMVSYKFEQIPTNRHLKGNWLAYWRHEISRSDKDVLLNFKQIKLQSFTGHTNSIRSLIALDNENSFISASKDKTVKLWSLRSEGDGRKNTTCQFTYTAHKKSIDSLAFLESMRLVVSCDSGVHFWDPFIGRPISILDSAKHNPVTIIKSLPSPSPLIVAGTSEATVKIIDSRCMQYVNEWRVGSLTQNGATVRCLTVAPSGNWLAVGLSSGNIVIVDTRTGIILKSWRPIDSDVLLQLNAPNDHLLISSALDHSLAVWHAIDGILHYQMRPPPEPAHFLQTIDNELIYATSGNRIGIYSDLCSSHAPHTVTKLRSETFRGVLKFLTVLPLNRAFLAGNESGSIVLLC